MTLLQQEAASRKFFLVPQRADLSVLVEKYFVNLFYGGTTPNQRSGAQPASRVSLLGAILYRSSAERSHRDQLAFLFIRSTSTGVVLV